MTHLGYRLERHNAHMEAVRRVQRRNQLGRVERALARLQGSGTVLDDLELIETLEQLRAGLIGKIDPKSENLNCGNNCEQSSDEI